MATATDLFESAADDRGGGPLAARMRPRSLDELVGQQHLLAAGSPLRRLVEGDDRAVSLILYGPPGTGKTTIAHLVSRATGRRFAELSAVTAGVKDVRAVVDEARRRLGMGEAETVLFVDEVHRFSKTQQDALLPAVENGWVVLIAATTENPHFAIVVAAAVAVAARDAPAARRRRRRRRSCGVRSPTSAGWRGRSTVDDEAVEAIVRLAGGDARRALTILDAAAAGAPVRDGEVGASTTVARAVDQAAVRYDRDGDQHYDVTSAFIKSIRGSDVDAALHYLARMIEAGEDPRFIARRLVIHASEDVGMADPSALQTAVAALRGVRLRRAARGADPAGAGGDPPGDGTEVERGHRGDRRGDRRRPARADRRGARRICGTATTRARRTSGRQGYAYPHDDPRGVLRPAVRARHRASAAATTSRRDHGYEQTRHRPARQDPLDPRRCADGPADGRRPPSGRVTPRRLTLDHRRDPPECGRERTCVLRVGSNGCDRHAQVLLR